MDRMWIDIYLNKNQSFKHKNGNIWVTFYLIISSFMLVKCIDSFEVWIYSGIT